MLTWSLCQIIMAQDNSRFPFHNLTVEKGLSQNSAISIVQDSTGYLWIATQDGLNRYSGKDFLYYDKKFEDVTRPHFSRLGKVYIDRQNNLWIVLISGVLERYNPVKDNFEAISGFPKVSNVFQTKNLDFYIGTYGNGLFKIDAISKDTTQLFIDGEDSITVYDFLEYKDTLWVACSNKVYAFSSQQTYKEIKVQSTEISNYSTLEQTNDHTLWLGTYGNGLFYKPVDSSQFKPFRHPKIPQNLNIEDVMVDSKNRLWIATYGHGAYLYNPVDSTVVNFIENQDNPFAIHYNDLLCLFEDNSGVVWIGTDGAGVSFYDSYHLKFNVLTDKHLPRDATVDIIKSITTDDHGNMWLGTAGKGLTKVNIKQNKYHTFTPQNSSLSSERIISLYYDGTDLWIGHQGFGLDVGNPSEKLRTFPEISNYTIYRILRKSSTQSWLCTESNGLVLFDKFRGVIKRYNTDNSNLLSNNIKTVEIENDSVLWLGTDQNGLVKLNTRSRNASTITVVPDKIKSLYYADGILWIGTYGNGLKKYNIKTGNVARFSTEQGLPNDVVYGVLPDDDKKHLWLSSNKGIIKFNTDDNSVTIYNNHLYLQSYEFNTGAYYKDDSGILYFGGLKGLNWFHPEDLKINPYKPKTVITKIEVFNKEVPLVEGLELKHDKNTVTFTFASLQFSQPEQNKYKYKLINNDDSWTSSKNANVAHYTNLPPNHYEFQVVSSNYDGVWSQTPAIYSFTILKPWYATNLAFVVYGILFISCIYLLYVYLKWRWNIKNQLRLKQEETQSLKKADELKSKLFANISHEFRTPLTLISGPVESQLKKSNLTEKDSRELSLIKKNSDRLLELIKQMMDLSMLDSGQKTINLSLGNLHSLLLQLIEVFQYKAETRKITIQSVVHDLYECWYDKDMIEKIVSNLLSNAIKYAPEGSVVELSVEENDGAMIFTIVNNIEQMNSTDLSKLFQRFYQDRETSEGVGIGLALVKELIELAHGEIVVNALADKKIKFVVSLPVERASFAKTPGTHIVQNEENTPPKVEAVQQLELSKDNTSVSPHKNGRKSTNTPTLLVVEDNSDMREFIVSTLVEDYHILEAENGKEGIEKAQRYLPDLVISDIMMPIVNGFELCDTIKQDVLTSHIPLILLTAKVGEENKIKGFQTGADAYITKPFSIFILQVRVRQLLDAQKRLVEHFSETFSVSPDMTIADTESDFLELLKLVMEEHLTDTKLNTEKLCQLMQLSRSQLYRKIKAILRMSPMEFVKNQRVKLAADLLKTSDANITEISYQVGFNTPSYFIKCFKETYGCTPSEFTTYSQ